MPKARTIVYVVVKEEGADKYKDKKGGVCVCVRERESGEE